MDAKKNVKNIFFDEINGSTRKNHSRRPSAACAFARATGIAIMPFTTLLSAQMAEW